MAKKKEKSNLKKEVDITTRREQFRQQSIIEAIIIGVFCLYFGLTFAAVKSKWPDIELFDTLDYIKGVIFCQPVKGNPQPFYSKPNPFFFVQQFMEKPYNPFGPVIFVGLIELLWMMYYFVNKAKIHSNLETLKGSTVWEKCKYITGKYAEMTGEKEDDFRGAFNNGICSQNVYVSMNTKKHFKAVNMLILGATGSGKSRYYLKPNILQMNTSYVVTDPKGEILDACGEMLRRNGYNVRVFDISETGLSTGQTSAYNPLKYCYKESDIRKLIEAFMKNTSPDGGKKGGGSSDPFWDDATRMLLSALVGFLVQKPTGCDTPYSAIPEVTGGRFYEPCFANLCELVRMVGNKWKPGGPVKLMEGVNMEPDKNAPQKGSEVGAIFENIRAYEAKIQGCEPDRIQKPYCLREWENFWGTPEKTATTILTTASVKLDPFNIEQIKNMTSYDTINLDTFGKGRDALFLIISPADKTYNFLVSFLYTQLFDQLYSLGSTGCVGAKFMKMQNGELVRFFSAEEVERDGGDWYKHKVEAIKNSHMEEQNFNGIKKGEYETKDKKGKKVIQKVSIYDGWYDIVDADGDLVTRRSTKEAANAYLKDLKDSFCRNPKIPEIPCHVRFLMDEFPNIGEVPEFKEKLATMRGYEISATVICQSITQLKGMYPDDYSVIDGNCPFVIYLGGDENDTCEYISKKMGSTTVQGQNLSVNGGKELQLNTSGTTDERALMKPEEIGRMDYSKQLVLIYGEQPIQDDKFDYPKHKNYKLSRDYAQECGTDAIMFDRASLGHIGSVEIVRDCEIATAMCDVQQFSMEKFLSIMQSSNIEEALQKEEKIVKRNSFEADSEEGEWG